MVDQGAGRKSTAAFGCSYRRRTEPEPTVLRTGDLGEAGHQAERCRKYEDLAGDMEAFVEKPICRDWRAWKSIGPALHRFHQYGATIWMRDVLPHRDMFPNVWAVASRGCSRGSIRVSAVKLPLAKHQGMSVIPPPGLEAALKCANLAVGIPPWMLLLETLQKLTTCAPGFGQEPVMHQGIDLGKRIGASPAPLRLWFEHGCWPHLAAPPSSSQSG